MMLVHLQVAASRHLQIEQPVHCHLSQHVIEKTDPGLEAMLPYPVQV